MRDKENFLSGFTPLPEEITLPPSFLETYEVESCLSRKERGGVWRLARRSDGAAFVLKAVPAGTEDLAEAFQILTRLWPLLPNSVPEPVSLFSAGELDCLVRAYLPTLEKWVRYLERYGADPGEQLCTDDFAGHLAHNVNLALKAVCGLAAYGWMMERMGETAKAQEAVKASREMAQSVLARAKTDEGTSLTLDGKGWSLKYNAVWDLLFGFGLFDQAFYRGEIARYRKEQNRYGVPLDSRADYTKSDWILWAAAMGENAATVEALSEPIVRYLQETPTRVPFSDWYDTKTGRYCAFIARSVQGGIFMPLLKDKWLA